MSLINRMLRDLSTRTPPSGDVMGGVQIRTPMPRRGLSRGALLLALVGAFSAAMALFGRAAPRLVEPAAATPAPASAAPVPAAMREAPAMLPRFQLVTALAQVPTVGPVPRRRPGVSRAAEAAALETRAASPAAPAPAAAAPLDAASRKMQARQLLELGHPAEAATLLGADAPAVRADPEYHGILAAAYQQSGRHAEAVLTYEQLIRAQPSEAHWWAGFGLSKDALGDSAAALNAYAQARERGRLEPRVLQHINRRTAALQAAAG